MAYYRAACHFFAWVEQHEIGGLTDLEPVHVAAYIEVLQTTAAKPTVKLHLAAIRMLFDWLVVGQVLAVNPAHAVRGPKHVVRRGKTPVLTEEQARRLLESIDTSTVVGLRDRALIGVMTYAFARIGAVVAMRVEDYYPEGKRWWVRLHEKGGKRHEMPTHHKLEVFIDEYLAAAGIREDGKGYLFRSAIGKTGTLTDKPMNRVDAYRMVRRRTANAGFKVKLGCHVFRATGRTLRGRPNRAGPNILSVWSAASDSTRNLTPDKNRSVSPLTRFSEHGPHILSRRGALRMAPC